MKAKTKLQQRVLELSKKLPIITEEQKTYAYKKCGEHLGYRLKSGKTSCLECGNSFQSIGKKCVCPSCNTTLSIEDTKKRKYKDCAYFCIFSTKKEYQVIRYFLVTQSCEIGKKSDYDIYETVQQWILPNGNNTILSLKYTCAFYNFKWDMNSDLMVRFQTKDWKQEIPYLYNIGHYAIYPKKQILPIFKRNGFNGRWCDARAYYLLSLLCSDNKAETLLKAKQYRLLQYMLKWGHLRNEYFASAKICIRNKYIIKDASMWCDYIDFLIYLGKDTRNAKYVCPLNLRKEHDRYLKKKQRKVREEMFLKKKRKLLSKEDRMMQDAEVFKQLKSKYFSKKITDNNINIVVLDSVEEYLKEGEYMHNCVFSNDFHLKPYSLVLSARIGEERIATIELSLKTFEIVECYGAFNKKPQHYDKIISMVNKNIGIFRNIA